MLVQLFRRKDPVTPTKTQKTTVIFFETIIYLNHCVDN